VKPHMDKLLFGLMMIALSACAMMPGNPVALATPIPTFPPADLSTPAPNITQTAALGGKQSGDLFVWIYSNPNPPIRGENLFDAYVTDANGKPVTDAKITFDIDMTNMSHGKNVVSTTSMGEGHYNGKLAFLMPGPWRVLVAIERGGQTSTVRFDFTVDFK
jgi:hypothetical protein